MPRFPSTPPTMHCFVSVCRIKIPINPTKVGVTWQNVKTIKGYEYFCKALYVCIKQKKGGISLHPITFRGPQVGIDCFQLSHLGCNISTTVGKKNMNLLSFFSPSLFGDNRKLVTTFSIRCVRGNCVLLTSFLVASKYFKMAKHLSLARCGCFARLTRRLLGKTHKRFIRGVNGTASVYDPNYHLCFSAYFNHGHIPLPLSRVQHTLSRHRQTVELELNNG